MAIKEKYVVKPIDSYLCKEWCLKKHYAKRIPPIEYAFGLFDNNGFTQGIVTYGTPVSNTLRNLWNNEFKLMELNRLVINEGLEKNLLSFLVGQSLKKITISTCYCKLCRYITKPSWIYLSSNKLDIYRSLSAF